jgi:hypothetical protein
VNERTLAAPIADEWQQFPRASAGPVEVARTGGTAALSARFAHADFARIRINAGGRPLQCKIQIGHSADPLEQEADRVADSVMRTPAKRTALTPAPANSLARKCGSECTCGPCSDDEQLQRKTTGANDAVAEAPDTVGRVLGSSGEPLDTATRAFFEPRFGRDFSDVRIHNGASAEQSARQLGAQAYTVGRDIVFDTGNYAPSTSAGRWLLAHELAHVEQQLGGRTSVPALLQRKCKEELGAPRPDCTPSQTGVVGWLFHFRVGCDDLLPGEEATLEKLKTGSQLKIHGFASREGDPNFNSDLSCHRANRIAELVRQHRADCTVLGTYKHGASPVSGPGVVKDPNPPELWRSVNIEEIAPPTESGELWLDPSSKINSGWALLRRAKVDPTQANLDIVSARRVELKAWLENIGKTLAAPGVKLGRGNIDDYRRFYASAEKLWVESDQLLALKKHAAAAQNTYTGWASGSGDDQDKTRDYHAKDVPQGARYHVDIFGEGFYKGAINIGDAERTSTTGVHGARVPNLIYRHFSSKDGAELPIGDHVADLITSENGPIQIKGLAEEMVRIIAPGGTIVLENDQSFETQHDEVVDKIVKATRGRPKKTGAGHKIQTTIVVPEQ